jgi:CheY-like chemotaxis protein
MVTDAAFLRPQRVPDSTMTGYVLLVEDNDDIREMMSLALQLSGARVVGAANGREALAILENRPPPNLILLDLMMPVMNGWELSAVLKRDEALAKVPIVVISAMGEAGAAGLQPAEVLSKPVDIDHLIDVVKRLRTSFKMNSISPGRIRPSSSRASISIVAGSLSSLRARSSSARFSSLSC